MPDKAKKGGKGREVSKASRRKKRTTPKRYAPTPTTDAARLFLYECPGGMDENEKRDKFLECAKKAERTGAAPFNVVENVVRAALFQGQAHGRGNPQMRKKDSKCGPLDMGDKHVLRVLMAHIGKELFKRLDSSDDGETSELNSPFVGVAHLPDSFDCTGEEPDLWNMELHCLAWQLLDRILGCTQEKLKVLMGASAWKSMGLPKF